MTLTAYQIDRLSRLHNRATRYEAVIVSPTGEAALLAYTGRKSKIGLLHAARNRAQEVIAFARISETDTMQGDGRDLKFANGARIKFSGRTQRDAIMCGELPYVATLVTV